MPGRVSGFRIPAEERHHVAHGQFRRCRLALDGNIG